MALTDFVEILIHTDYLVDEPDIHLQSLTVRLPVKPMKISQLIKLKIAQEIHAYNERLTRSYGADYLPTEEYQDILFEGREFYGRPLIKGKGNPDKEAKHALRAYFNARFQVECDGKVHSVEDPIVEISENSVIRFVRLFDYQ